MTEEIPDTFVPASTISQVTKSHYRKVRDWAERGLIRTQQLEGCRRRYSLRDAYKLVEESHKTKKAE